VVSGHIVLCDFEQSSGYGPTVDRFTRLAIQVLIGAIPCLLFGIASELSHFASEPVILQVCLSFASEQSFCS